jgi:nucleoside-diphosphate-sugar epimerase
VVPSLPDTAGYAELMRGVELVVHLAARVHVMDEKAVNPLEEFRKVNVAGTEQLARQAAAAGVRRLVFMSSVKVNGEGGSGKREVASGKRQAGSGKREAGSGRQGGISPYTEDDPPAPEDPYGVSKQEAEDVLRRVARETGLEVVIIRAPLVYGPGVKANFLQLMRTVHRGIPLPVGCIHNRRSLIGLGNLVDAVIACVKHPNAAGNTFLVCDDDDVSTPELVRRIAAALGRQARVFPVPLALLRLAGAVIGKRAAVDRLVGSLTVDTGKIRRELGWKPPFTMEQGLRETAEWVVRQDRRSSLKEFRGLGTPSL